MNEQTERWTENWMNSQRVVISDMKSSWRPVRIIVTQGSILGPVPLNIISDLGDGTVCTLSRFAGDTRLGGVAVHQRVVLPSREQWAGRNLTTFGKGKCQTLHLGRSNLKHQHMLGAAHLAKVFAEKAFAGPGGHQVEHEPAICSCGKEGLMISQAGLDKVLAAGGGR
ncbi:hypothetical protein BTVI_78081 [Pitangus sulphuratus]|nr:hypothetical protein BTVI_78081 [Pitangus sulphuratus]